jgi:hypothetical protein
MEEENPWPKSARIDLYQLRGPATRPKKRKPTKQLTRTTWITRLHPGHLYLKNQIPSRKDNLTLKQLDTLAKHL